MPPDSTMPRWKQYKKEKVQRADPPTNNMAKSIAKENGVSPGELAEFAEFMDVDPVAESYLLPIVAEAMNAPLPEHWRECEDASSGQYYYAHTQTQQTTWEHPLDQYFKNLLFVERRNYKDRAKSGHREAGAAAGAHVQQPAGDVTARAADLYMKAQLEEKDQELASMREELEDSTNYDALRQMDKAKESRLLREQNSKLQTEVEQLRKSKKKEKKKGGWFGKASKEDVPEAEEPEPEQAAPRASPGPSPAKPWGNGDTPGRRGGGGVGKLQQEALYQLREGTRELRHALLGTKLEVTALKKEIDSGYESSIGQIMFKMAMVEGGAALAGGSPPRDSSAEVSSLRQETERLQRALSAAEARAQPAGSPGGGAAHAAELEALRREAEQGARASEQLNMQLRSAQDEQASVLAMLSGRGGGANLRSGVQALLDEIRTLESRTTAVEGDLEQRTKSASSALAGERASFEIERSALLSETASLNSQLEALRKAAAEAEAAGSASQSEIASQLSEARAAAQSEADEARRLREQLEGAASDKREGADALERMTRAHAAKEDEVARIREQLDDVNSVNAGNAKRHEEELGSLKQKLDEEQQAKATLESEQQAQFEQMQAREQKAASECERMFKLVQQAHTKVQEKEKNFKRQLEQERERFAATLEAEVAQRMEGIQKKYEEEARQRRKLFNIVQELQGNIRVYCRVRPCLADEEHLGVGIEFKGEHDDLIIQNPRDKLAPKRFEFEKTFRTDMGQADVFEAVGPLCCSAMDGYNVCIFAYGQTGSGKTYSMEGPVGDRGVYYNAVNALFNIKDERAEFARYDISVSLLEIYNENVKDLLGSGEGPEYLEIRRGPQGVFVPGLEEVPVGNADEVMEVLMRGNERRAVATTKMNEASSRSHSLLCVNVVRTTRPTAERPQGGRTRSQLTLVDLAGSERLSKSEAKGQAQKEAQHINKSLSALADVIAARAAKQAHVPYRNSKLTSLLEDSLGGDSKTLMLVHCRPTADNIGETLCTLNFASRVRSVEMKKADARESARVARGAGV